MTFIDALAAIFTAHPPQTFDRTGSTDGYLGNFSSLPVGQDERGNKYLSPGTMPDFTQLINRRD